MAAPRIIVFGYHDVGYTCLEALINANANVVALFTHQDNPKEKIWFKSPAELAKQHNIPIYTPEDPNQSDIIQLIQNLKPDIIFSFYYRHMICETILNLPRLGAFNMHGSLLPRYRGRVPINWAIIHGETQTGATLHHMVKRADAGDIVDQLAVSIEPEATAQQVFYKVTQAARHVIEKQLPALLEGNAPRNIQDETQASYFSGRKPEDGQINWQTSSQQIFNLIRAVTDPYPGAYTYVNGKKLIIWWAKFSNQQGTPGQILSTHPFVIATQDGALHITRWQWADENQIHEESITGINNLTVCE